MPGHAALDAAAVDYAVTPKLSNRGIAFTGCPLVDFVLSTGFSQLHSLSHLSHHHERSRSAGMAEEEMTPHTC
jgi:hypothetical protein